MIRSIIILLFLVSFSFAKEQMGKEKCFSCLIEVNSLDKPIDLSGKWLFKKFNNHESKWHLSEVPGTWGENYEEKFSKGVYKANFKFTKNLLGAKTALVLDNYLGNIEIKVNGESIYKRYEKNLPSNYNTFELLKIPYTIDDENIELLLIVDSIYMRGIHQSPFQLRMHKNFDKDLALRNFFMKDLRGYIGISFFMMGCFFLILFLLIRKSLYLQTFFVGIIGLPYLSFPNDFIINLIGPDKVYIIHYLTICFTPTLFFTMVKNLTKSNNKDEKIYFGISFVFSALLLTQLNKTFFNLEFFHYLRLSIIVYSYVITFGTLVYCYNMSKNEKAKVFLFIGFLSFFAVNIHDFLVFNNIIQSVDLFHLGLFTSMFGIHIYNAYSYAQNFAEKKVLLGELQELNEHLEIRVGQRTKLLKKANTRIVELAHNAGMAEIANGVIHDIGNFLTSVATVKDKMSIKIKKSKLMTLSKFNQHVFVKMKDKIDPVLGDDIPKAYLKIESILNKENQELSDLTFQIGKSIDAIKGILQSQQEYAKVKGIDEKINLKELIDDILLIESHLLERARIKFTNNVDANLDCLTQKNRLFNIMGNIIKNAVDAMESSPLEERSLTIYSNNEDEFVSIHFKDTGCGISEEQMKKMFTHGHTTKKDGHGFGLHASFNAMKEIGGELKVLSEGENKGAEFIIRLSLEPIDKQENHLVINHAS